MKKEQECQRRSLDYGSRGFPCHLPLGHEGPCEVLDKDDCPHHFNYPKTSLAHPMTDVTRKCDICNGSGDSTDDSGCPCCAACGGTGKQPVAPAPTASARVFAIQETYDEFLEQYTTPKDCGVLPPDVCWTWVEAWAKFYASSQSSKLEGVGQEAAEKIATYISQISNQSPVRSRSQATQEFAAIIDELIAGRLACK